MPRSNGLPLAGPVDVLKPAPLTGRKDLHLSQRKIRDRSIALLLAGILVLLPPIAGISLIEKKIGGVPFALLYVFAVWALLIAGAAALARPLRESESRTSSANLSDTAG